MALILQNLILIILSLAGFSLAFFIYYKKCHDHQLVCPLRSDCNVVVRSSYSKFCSLPVEILGMIYFGLIFILQAIFILYPTLSLSMIWLLFSLAISLIAFVFSIYLTAIQLFILRQWCFWCIICACISAAIFILRLSIF